MKICYVCSIPKHKSEYYFSNVGEQYWQCISCFNDEEMKQCTLCKKVIDIEAFYFRNDTKTYRKECKECTNSKHRTYWKEYSKRPETIQKRNEYIHDSENKEHKRLYDQQHRKGYENNKRATDMNYRLKKNIRSRIIDAIKNNRKSGRTLELLGCELNFFKKWIEYQFTAEMHWGNYGSYWHIDHIKPCASYDMSEDGNQMECFNWKNQQPMYKLDNIAKKDKYDINTQIKAEIMLKSFMFQNKLDNVVKISKIG